MSDVAAEDIEREAEPITDRVHDNYVVGELRTRATH